MRHLVFLYGAAVYALFLGCFLYAIGFVGDLVVPRSLDSGPAAPLGQALLVDTGLLLLFGLQHSGMARPGFKRVWTRLVPPSIERSTYVLATVVAFALLFALWRPLPGVVWSVSGVPAALLWGLFGLGWALVLAATFMINHFDLFGLRQVWIRWRERPYEDLGFRTPALYRLVRHPIQLGFLIAFWATPVMTIGHLLFAAGTTGYILVALRLEERDLIRAFGDTYRRYRERVRMFVPFPR